ncbi:MAG: hypothetical protein P8Z37_18905 [Acidobacteriota bacterium]|jgi:hypothetical protein
MRKLFKSKLLLTLAMFVPVISLSTVMAFTLDPGYGVKAEIPFAFNAGNKQFPAGEYSIVRTETVEPTMVVKNANGIDEEFLVVEDTNNMMQTQTPEIVFHKIGDKEFLREIRTGETVYLFEAPRLEKQLEMQSKKMEVHKISSSQINK